jgi:hypothetical protein
MIGQSLDMLIILAPGVISALALFYFKLSGRESVATSYAGPRLIFSCRDEYKPTNSVLILLCLTPVILYLSWMTFWIISIILLGYCISRRGECNSELVNESTKPIVWVWLTILFISLSAVIFTLSVSRNDLDDAFYVAVAAFASGNPSKPLLAFDPMHGEISLPLIFPSYKFASFELLSGAIGHLINLPVMEVYYILLPPLCTIAAVFSIFLLARELMPNRWLLLGIVTLLLIILLGEMHRAPANFSFVRIFQGKAVYLSVIVPAIFYLTARYVSRRGTSADLFLLGCCQITAIGLSNFGMLAAPIAGFGALLSNIPIIMDSNKTKMWGLIAIIAIPMPFLLDVLIESNTSSVLQMNSESAMQVWASVFGSKQQYLVGILLLIGPILTRDLVTRWRLAVPPLLLYSIYLNPWLSDFISKNITTPPVYWRVVWSFPILIFVAASVCIIIDRLILNKAKTLFPAILSSIVLGLIIFSLPYNTLRSDNSGFSWRFASLKVPANDFEVAEKAIKLNGNAHRLLAPDEISGVITRFESHPKLVSVRGLYLDMLISALGSEAYLQRRILYDFVTGAKENDKELVRKALNYLDVSTVVISQGNENKGVVDFLKSDGYQMIELVNGYSIWLLTSFPEKSKKL